MKSSDQYRSFKSFIWIGLLILTACNNNSSTNTVESSTIPELNQANVAAFSSRLKQDYDTSLESLLQQFDVAQNNNDSYSFVDYRNNKWTPVYINKKDFYAAVSEKNKDYLTSSPIAPMFDYFEHLIYIGLDLKNGLLDNDQHMIEQALLDAKTHQKAVHALVISDK